MILGNIVIGKRVTLGAAISGVAAVIAYAHPEHAPAILAGIVPITFALQVLIAHYMGITTEKDND